MTALENRQEAILAKLAGLKNQIQALRAELKQPSIPSVTVGTDISASRTCSILQVCFPSNIQYAFDILFYMSQCVCVYMISVFRME